MEAERAAAARCDARGPTTLARVWQRSSRWGGAGGRPAVCWGEGRWRMGGQGGNRGGPATGVTTGRAPLTAEQTCAPAGAASGTAAAVGATAAAATQPGGSPRGLGRQHRAAAPATASRAPLPPVCTVVGVQRDTPVAQAPVAQAPREEHFWIHTWEATKHAADLEARSPVPRNCTPPIQALPAPPNSRPCPTWHICRKRWGVVLLDIFLMCIYQVGLAGVPVAIRRGTVPGAGARRSSGGGGAGPAVCQQGLPATAGAAASPRLLRLLQPGFSWRFLFLRHPCGLRSRSP